MFFKFADLTINQFVLDKILDWIRLDEIFII